MTEQFEKWKAEMKIPEELRAKDREIYTLMETITSRYSQLDLADGDFQGLDEKEKLSKLIGMINKDPEISELHSLKNIGSIRIKKQKIDQVQGPISGLNLCIGKNGLSIVDWHRFLHKHDAIPATVSNLGKYLEGITTESLRADVVRYTEKKKLYRERQPFS